MTHNGISSLLRFLFLYTFYLGGVICMLWLHRCILQTLRAKIDILNVVWSGQICCSTTSEFKNLKLKFDCKAAQTSIQASRLWSPNWSNQRLHLRAKSLPSQCDGRSHRCRLGSCQTEIEGLFLTQIACMGGQASSAGIPASCFPSCSFNDGCCKWMWSWKSGRMWDDLLGNGGKKLHSNNVNQRSVVIVAVCIEIVGASVYMSQLSASLRVCLGGLPLGALLI